MKLSPLNAKQASIHPDFCCAMFFAREEEFVFKLSDGSIVRESAIPEMSIEDLQSLLDACDRQLADIKMSKNNYLSSLVHRKELGRSVDLVQRSNNLHRFNAGIHIQNRLKHLIVVALREKQAERIRDEKYIALTKEHEKLVKAHVEVKRQNGRIKHSKHKLVRDSQNHIKRLTKENNRLKQQLNALQKHQDNTLHPNN